MAIQVSANLANFSKPGLPRRYAPRNDDQFREEYMFEAFISGIILMLGLLLPFGAQKIFVFNQAATQPRFISALPSILTVILCDVILISLAVLGISLVVLHIAWLKNTLFILGFCFLIYIGWITWNNYSHKLGHKPEPLVTKKQIIYAVSLSLLNPHAIFHTVGVIGTNSLHYIGQAKLIYTLGCITISIFWFLGLGLLGHSLQKLNLNAFWFKALNKISAIIIWIVAGYIGWHLLNTLQT